MDDIRPVIGDDDRRSMTYAEIATARGISAKSAERLVRRRRWPKQPGNDGAVRVLVPAAETQPGRHHPGHPPGYPGGHQAGHPPGHPPGHSALDHPPDILPAIREAIREVIRPLSEQIDAANRRADAERERADRERDRADQAERRITELERTAARRRWWPWRR